MSPRVFTLPDLGEGLTDAELVRWLVAVGDTVATDQPIAEVETAKSVVEVPSPYAGTVAALHGDEGSTILVGAPLIEVEETAPAGEAPSASGSGSGQVLVGYGTVEHGARRRRAGRGSTVTASRPVVASPAAPPPARGVVPVISPVIRALARSHGIDLTTLRPSRPDGVITRHDVEAAFASATAGATAPTTPTAPAAATAPTAATATAATTPTAPTATATAPTTTATAPTTTATAPTTGAVDARTGLAVAATTPFSRLRRTVAETMTRSRSEIPEATVWVDVDATDLWEGRRRLVRDGRAPSFLAFVSRFALSALARHPELGGRVAADGQGITTFDGVNLGFAADTDRGLLVPVVRRADRLSARELDAELDRLARAAREGTLPPADLTGSTFTINNYGSLGVDGSAAIINHPEVAILGLGRAIERPWVVDGAIVPRRTLQLSLVFDHRVTDGGVAAGFLREVADAIESPLGVLADTPGPLGARA